MEEARRFLRYVVPGLIFVIEVAFYLLISAHSQFIVELQKVISRESSIGIAVTGFLASGGLGYIFANIYHAAHNLIQTYNCIFSSVVNKCIVDHRPLLECARERGWLKITEPSGRTLSRVGAWRIVTAIWQSKIETSSRIKSANYRVNTLTDILHGLGASLIASIVAFPFWIYVHNKLTCCMPLGNATLLPVIMVIVFTINYCVTAKHIQSVLYVIVSDELRAGWPREMDVSKSDLE